MINSVFYIKENIFSVSCLLVLFDNVSCFGTFCLLFILTLCFFFLTSATESLVDKVASFGTCDNSSDSPFLYFLYSCPIFWLQLAFVIDNKIKQKHSSFIQLVWFYKFNLTLLLFHFLRRSKADNNSATY